MLALSVIGCGQRPKEPNSAPAFDGHIVEATDASLQTSSPRQYLEAVFARYRRAGSYCDRGLVRLEYKVGQRLESKTAPMTIWFDHNRLYLEAYDVRLWSDGDFMTAWIRDAESHDFDSQVMRMPAISGRPTVKMLFSDPILADRISAGLAGPPPQLDWLLAGRPMAALFESSHRFEFGEALAIDGALCRGIRIEAGPELYQFWVDETKGVIRRVELPSIVAPAAPGEPLQSMSLSLELNAPAWECVAAEPEFAPLPRQPKFVRRFVPLPAAEPPSILGMRSPSFRLVDQTGKRVISDRSGDASCTLLVHFAADPQSLSSIAAIDQWSAGRPENLKQRVSVALLVPGQFSDLVPPDLDLAVVHDDDRLAPSLELPPGGLAILDGAGRVAWTQPQLPPASAQALATLGAIVGDILDGVDVPARVRQQWSEQVNQYRRSLQRESIGGK